MLVSLYAGAADAAGTNSIRVDRDGLTAAELLGILGEGNEGLAATLSACTLLVDGAAAATPGERISADARVEVLPPFAGG